MYPRRPRSHPYLVHLLLALGLLAALMLSACDATYTGTVGTVGKTPTPDKNLPTATSSTGQPTVTSASGGHPVKVFFSKHPDSDGNVNAVFSVDRVSPDLGVARFALRQLIVGPTASEHAAGYYTDLTASLVGSSNCGGDDFQLYPDHKGATTASPGTMTIKFCRATQLAGDLTGARIVAEINKTMLQFDNIHAVVILGSDGNCFNDFQGANACLH